MLNKQLNIVVYSIYLFIAVFNEHHPQAQDSRLLNVTSLTDWPVEGRAVGIDMSISIVQTV